MPAPQELLVILAGVPAYDRTHRRVDLKRRGINGYPFPLQQASIPRRVQTRKGPCNTERENYFLVAEPSRFAK
jgi:hypothetical protein